MKSALPLLLILSALVGVFATDRPILLVRKVIEDKHVVEGSPFTVKVTIFNAGNT
jgi:hypothetical protein